MTRIMVGVGGGEAAHPAIEWAATHARGSGDVIELAHVVDVTWGVVPAEFTERALLEAEQGLRAQVRGAVERHPGVSIHSSVLVGSPTEELVKAAEQADLLVIGARRHGEFGTSGRRTTRIAARAACSVVVVPPDLSSPGSGVVVGIDGSDASADAVQFAAREADRFGEALTVIYSWTPPEPWSTTDTMLWPSEPSEEDHLVVAEAVAGLAQDYPDLAVRSEVVSARPERALYAASVGARMLVVGSRGRHGLTKLFLGSVSEGMVFSLPCTVAVIRPEPTAEPQPA